MAITYNLLPIPKWYLADLTGRPLGGGRMFTRSSLNKVADKPVFQDPGGNIPWPNPVPWDLNGTQGPFYWKFDDTMPNDLYFLVVQDAAGNEVFTQDDFGAPSGGGGGGGGTTIIPNKNYIINNVFLNHTNDFNPAPVPVGNTILAPGAHSAFQFPETLFIKGASTAADTLRFVPFGQGNTPLSGDNTPLVYVNYNSNSVVGESVKAFQFPIQPKVKVMENQTFTFTIWAQNLNVAASSIRLDLYKYYGDGGGASAPDFQTIATFALPGSGAWTQFRATLPISSTAGKVLGTCGNDGSYLRVNMPIDQSVNVNFCKPSCYYGNLNAISEFESDDQIYSDINMPRTGDHRISLNSFQPFSWVPMNDGVINRNQPVVPGQVVTRANQDTFYLYSILWTLNDADVQRYSPTGALLPLRGASAAADFDAGNSLTLTKQLGRTIASAGSGAGLTARRLGQNIGFEDAVVVSHTHTGDVIIPTDTTTTGGNSTARAGVTLGPGFDRPLVINPTGVTGVGRNMQPTSFANVFLKL